VREHKTAVDWAEEMAKLLNEDFSQGRKGGFWSATI